MLAESCFRPRLASLNLYPTQFTLSDQELGWLKSSFEVFRKTQMNFWLTQCLKSWNHSYLVILNFEINCPSFMCITSGYHRLGNKVKVAM